jgi:hypothetical protein
MKMRLGSARGQGILEFAIVLPLVLILVLGVVEISYALLDQHIVTKLTREGSNLISRNTSLTDAGAVMRTMSTRPVDFSSSSHIIFSVVKKGATTGTANIDKDILYQRYEFGPLTAVSTLQTLGTGAFTGPDYTALNSDTDTRLQITNLPTGLVASGGMIYITEIYSTHALITPLDRFGITVPPTLYSIAYF